MKPFITDSKIVPRGTLLAMSGGLDGHESRSLFTVLIPPAAKGVKKPFLPQNLV